MEVGVWLVSEIRMARMIAVGLRNIDIGSIRLWMRSIGFTKTFSTMEEAESWKRRLNEEYWLTKNRVRYLTPFTMEMQLQEGVMKISTVSYDILKKYTWYSCEDNGLKYARTNVIIDGERTSILAHRMLCPQ